MTRELQLTASKADRADPRRTAGQLSDSLDVLTRSLSVNLRLNEVVINDFINKVLHRSAAQQWSEVLEEQIPSTYAYLSSAYAQPVGLWLTRFARDQITRVVFRVDLISSVQAA